MASHLDAEIEELIAQVNNTVERMARKHHTERVTLLARHEGYLPYGVTAWAKHRTFDENYIFNQLKLEEILFNDLKGSKMKVGNIFLSPNSENQVVPLKGSRTTVRDIFLSPNSGIQVDRFNKKEWFPHRKFTLKQSRSGTVNEV